jgi:hypothetical protein
MEISTLDIDGKIINTCASGLCFHKHPGLNRDLRRE